MAMSAAGYILLAPPRRRRILLEAAAENEYAGWPVAEPVPRFQHSSRAPLTVFGSFQEGAITHLIDGRKGASAGTGLVRLNLTRWLQLERPVPFDLLLETIATRFRAPLLRTLEGGGLLPPKTLVAVVEALIRMAPETEPRLSRFSEIRRRRIGRIEGRSRNNLALQKEALTLSLSIAGMDRAEVLEWTPTEQPMQSFLDGLPGAEVREDTMLHVDHGGVPGFELGASTHVASRVFERPNDGVRLTVIMANRTVLEEQTGADLIYYNETYKAFVFVQYKAMRKEAGGTVFRWRSDPSDDLVKEIVRMENLLEEIELLGDDGTKESFRLHTNPFFLKICPKIVLNPDDKGLFSGMYIPLEYWKRFERDACSTGAKGGRYASFGNIGRRLNNSEFVPLVAGAWIGTTIPQSASLAQLIRRVLELGRTVMLAIERREPRLDSDDVSGVFSDFDPLDNPDD